MHGKVKTQDAQTDPMDGLVTETKAQRKEVREGGWAYASRLSGHPLPVTPLTVCDPVVHLLKPRTAMSLSRFGDRNEANDGKHRQLTLPNPLSPTYHSENQPFSCKLPTLSSHFSPFQTYFGPITPSHSTYTPDSGNLKRPSQPENTRFSLKNATIRVGKPRFRLLTQRKSHKYQSQD